MRRGATCPYCPTSGWVVAWVNCKPTKKLSHFDRRCVSVTERSWGSTMNAAERVLTGALIVIVVLLFADRAHAQCTWTSGNPRMCICPDGSPANLVGGSIVCPRPQQQYVPRAQPRHDPFPVKCGITATGGWSYSCGAGYKCGLRRRACIPEDAVADASQRRVPAASSATAAVLAKSRLCGRKHRDRKGRLRTLKLFGSQTGAPLNWPRTARYSGTRGFYAASRPRTRCIAGRLSS